MNTVKIEYGGIQAVLYNKGPAGSPLIVLNTFSGEENDVLKELSAAEVTGFSLLSVYVPDWNRDMSPFKCHALFKNEEDFGGGAGAFLEKLVSGIITEALKYMETAPEFTGIAGYSMAGLFALYALYNCDVFGRAASVSGSLWFPGIKEYALSHEPLKAPERIYLSLGDREDRSRDQILKTVRTNTEELAAHYADSGIDTSFELNPGNHFKDPALRTAKGIAALLRT